MKRIINGIHSFTKMEASGGICLIFSIVLALIFANTSFLKPMYDHLIHSAFSFELLGIHLSDKSFHFFVNDGLMAIFFFLIGLEVKREIISGELSNPKNVILPAIAAIGGLILPCLIYYYFNRGLPTESGWAVPAATDIALAFGVLTILGNRVPNSLKTFILMLAIFDDILVVGIIAIFFTAEISLSYIIGMICCCIVLGILNANKVENFSPFAIVGFILWYFTLQSGIHATIAGILFAAFIPMSPRFEYDEHGKIIGDRNSMLQDIEHGLHEFVSFFVLPVFAFVNSGVTISMADFSLLTEPLSLGIILGLFIGKQVGVFSCVLLLVKTKFVKLPSGTNYIQLYGVSILCGIGFTMGLFIGDLSYDNPLTPFKLPILIGSTLSALVGLGIISMASPKKA